MSDNEIDILLVEDNPIDLKVTLHAFKSGPGLRVQVARDGVEALDYVFCTGAYADRDMANLPRAILLDLMIPFIDGIEVLRRIKADPRTRSITIVMLTSSREERDVVETYQLGVNNYILKPLDFDQFAEVLRQLKSSWLPLNESLAPERSGDEN